MMPQIISVAELQKTKSIASEIGYPENFKIGIMVETPASVQLINELCAEGISFASFGTNDLTQYMLAIDRNNSDVQYIYDEMNPAILSALSYVIRRCKRYGVESSICGQAGSREDMVKFLVSEGIDSISVNADAAEKISKLVAELESGKEEKKDEVKEEEVEEKKEEVEEEKKEVEEKQESEPPVPTPTEPLEKPRESEEEGEKEEDKVQVSPKLNDGVPIPQQAIIDDMLMDMFNEFKGLGDEYRPSERKRVSDAPKLNDAIPIDSSLFEESEKQEFDLESELKKI